MITALNLSQPVEHRAAADPHQAMVDAALLGTGYGGGIWHPSVLSASVNRVTGIFAGADCDPVLAGLVPWISRQLVENGECVLFLDNSLRLRPVTGFDLQGSTDNRVYRTLTVSGPTRSHEYRDIRPEQVCHAVTRPCALQPWRGESWRVSAGIAVSQLAAIDAALHQDAAAPRGSLLPTVAAESPQRLTKLMGALMRLKGGLSSHPLLGRQGENPGPSPQPVRLQTSDLSQLRQAQETISGEFAESLGIPRSLLGIGSTGQTSRVDVLRGWIASTGNGWADTLRAEVERVMETPIRFSLEGTLARMVPFGQRIAAAVRLRKEGWSVEDSERLAGLR